VTAAYNGLEGAVFLKVKIYGSRGSVAFFSRNNTQYGGNTVCTMLDIDGHIVLLDCGSALMQFYYDMKDVFKDGFKFDVLLSHLHLDHIIGFSTFPPILSKDSDIRIFTRSRNELPLVSQIFGVFRPPYWPVEIADVTTIKAVEITGEDSFMLSDSIRITSFWSEHHNETVAFRVDSRDKTLVYLLDYEINANSNKYNQLVKLCQNADLVILDTTYLPQDYSSKRGWGHSTYEDGITLVRASSCKKMIFSHICQDYSDEMLNSIAGTFDSSKFLIAYDGMELTI